MGRHGYIVISTGPRDAAVKVSFIGMKCVRAPLRGSIPGPDAPIFVLCARETARPSSFRGGDYGLASCRAILVLWMAVEMWTRLTVKALIAARARCSDSVTRRMQRIARDWSRWEIHAASSRVVRGLGSARIRSPGTPRSRANCAAASARADPLVPLAPTPRTDKIKHKKRAVTYCVITVVPIRF